MDVNLKAQVLEIAKSNNLLKSDHNLSQSDVLKEAIKESNNAWQLINQEPLLLLKDCLDEYPQLKTLMIAPQLINNCEINFALIEDTAFSYELSTVMSLHTILLSDKSSQSEQEQNIANANHTFELQRSLPLPKKLSRLMAKVMSLGMYSQISLRTCDFHNYLTLLLPSIAIIKDLLQQYAQSFTDSDQNICDQGCCEVDSEPKNSQVSLDNDRLNCAQNILLLEMLPLWNLIFKQDFDELSHQLELFKELLLSFSEDLSYAKTMEEKKNYALYMLLINKMAAATKILCQVKRGEYDNSNSASTAIEQHIQVAIDLCDRLNLADIEIIARSLKVILLLNLNSGLNAADHEPKAK